MIFLNYRKVEQLAEEVESLNESVSKHLVRQQKRMQEAKERTDLLESAVMLSIFQENFKNYNYFILTNYDMHIQKVFFFLHFLAWTLIC